MHIRNCTAADIEQAALIFREAYASQPYNESWETANASAYLKRFLDIEPAGCFVAEVDGHIAGAILSFTYPWHSGRATCIQELFVSEAFRARGVAHALVKSLSDGMRVNAWLVVHKAAGAAAFHQRLGFRKDGPYEFYYGAITP